MGMDVRSARTVLWLAVAVVLATAACASGRPNDFGDDDDDPDANRTLVDAGAVDGPSLPVDGPPPSTDAPAGNAVTLSQSSSMTVMPATSVACSTGENSYYRVFPLADHGVTSALAVDRVDFGVQDAVGVIGSSQQVQVKLHTLSGALAVANLTPIRTTAVTVANAASGTVVQVPISPPATIAAGSTMVVEVLAAGGGNQFILGANTSPETQPGYLRGPSCGSAAPVTFASISFPSTHIVVTASGTY